jgi:hypothetical protein
VGLAATSDAPSFLAVVDAIRHRLHRLDRSPEADPVILQHLLGPPGDPGDELS